MIKFLTLVVFLFTNSISFAYSVQVQEYSQKLIHRKEMLVTFVVDNSMNNYIDKIEKALNVWIKEAQIPFEISLEQGNCSRNSTDNINCISLEDIEEINVPGKAQIISDTQVGGIRDSDIIFDEKKFNCDVDRVILHELGHAFGLAHTDDKNAVMYESIDPNIKYENRLAQDDIDSIRLTYLFSE